MYRVSLNTKVMFGKATDEWRTPDACFKALDEEFGFALDVAATRENRQVDNYLGPDCDNPAIRDALAVDWLDVCLHMGMAPVCWMNPPYSRCREFITKAAQEARRGCTVVCLVPNRTDTRWWHLHVWDADKNTTRPGVEIRFIKGRLKFGNSTNSAPFPSVVIIFRQP